MGYGRSASLLAVLAQCALKGTDAPVRSCFWSSPVVIHTRLTGTAVSGSLLAGLPSVWRWMQTAASSFTDAYACAGSAYEA